MIILIGSNKGGSGKTTIACNLAVAFTKNGKEVCLVDADRQGSAARWHAEREAREGQENKAAKSNITVVQKYDNLVSTLQSLNEKYDVVIVDVAGRNSREMITAATVADYIICPAQCSQLDLDTLQELQQQVIQVKDLNSNLKVFIYQSMASTNPKVMDEERKQFVDYLSEFPQFLIVNSTGHYRKVYRDVFSDGLSVLEASNTSAKGEIEALYAEVSGW